MKYSKILIFLGIGCIAGLLLVFGIHLQAQNAPKKEITEHKVNKVNVKPASQMTQYRNRRQGSRENAKETKSDDNADFYRTIVDNNIFRPLGWRPPNKEPEYSLIGTAIDPNGGRMEAFVVERRSNVFYVASVGDKVGDAIVKEIEPKKVTLDKNGDSITLRSGSLQFLKSGGSRGGGGPSRGVVSKNESSKKESSSKSSDKEKSYDKEAAAKAAAMEKAREMERRFRNASPEERQEMIREFRSRRGRRGSR